MSKYNLIDIYEQYQIGSGWTTDFDYDGMLMAGLKAGVDTDIEILKKMSDDFEDVNYHRENSHLQNAIEALEEGAIKEASMFFGDFHAEIKQTIKDQGMDIEPTVGKFMDAKMDMMNEDEFDEVRQAAIESSQEAAGIKEDKDKEPRDGVKSAAAKLGMKPSHIKKENMYIDDDEFEMEMGRSKKDSLKKEMMIHVDQLIDGNIDMNDFINVVEDIMAEVKSMKEVMGIDRKGNKKPDTDGSDATKFKKAAMSEDEKKYTDTVAKMLKDRILKDIPMDIIIDFVKTHGSDIRRMNNSEIKDEFEEFRSVNYDYIDENLKAHFNRFK